jgi:hypothetical protein
MLSLLDDEHPENKDKEHSNIDNESINAIKRFIIIPPKFSLYKRKTLLISSLGKWVQDYTHLHWFCII